MVDQPQVQMRLSLEELEALDQVRTVLGERTYGIVPSRGELAKVAVLDWIAARQREFSAPPPEAPPAAALAPATAPSPPDALPDVAQGKAALAARVRALRQTTSHSKIAAMLNTEGVPTFGSKPGAKWSNSMVERLEKFGV